MPLPAPSLTPLLAHPPPRSVYFDRLPTLDTYHTRIMRDDGARLVRIRWYGDQDPTPQDVASGALVYVERKTHREKWSGEESSKVRGAASPLLAWSAAAADSGRACASGTPAASLQPLPPLTRNAPATLCRRTARRYRCRCCPPTWPASPCPASPQTWRPTPPSASRSRRSC